MNESEPLAAMLDVGKTHARLSFIDPVSGLRVWSASRANERVATSLMQELDVAGVEHWIISTLREAPHAERVRAFVPSAHGAAAILLDEDLRRIAAPDYEDPRFEEVSTAYSRERDDFAETFSPDLPLGLNLGRQLFYLEEKTPDLFKRVARVLTYPQYWSWRFSGVLASEVTSLGCHTDLWRPHRSSFSSLAHRHNWTQLLPSTRFAGETLGTITPEMAAATGLNPECRIACGIHDSNAAYLQHLLDRTDRPCAVISSGTWTIVMANKADLKALQVDHDMLANVDAFGSPVCTARFMGGREYAAIASKGTSPTAAAVMSVLKQRALALPSFACGGPYRNNKGALVNAAHLNDAERAALATLYVALMSDMLIDLLGAEGDVLIDGPLAGNALFAALLATWRPASEVFVSTEAGSCARAICFLGGFPKTPAAPIRRTAALDLPGLDDYRAEWRAALPHQCGASEAAPVRRAN
jgi:sugar (pentulose or hexulose) kinase